jgi:hypothetical protein
MYAPIYHTNSAAQQVITVAITRWPNVGYSKQIEVTTHARSLPEHALFIVMSQCAESRSYKKWPRRKVDDRHFLSVIFFFRWITDMSQTNEHNFRSSAVGSRHTGDS